MTTICHKATDRERVEHCREEAMLDRMRESRKSRPCPQRSRHVSAWPGYGRELCPFCRKYYIHSKEG